ncbi:MAG: PadR family transcriptional regulator [Streptosporangiaceae bacterium]|jgi:PadR family transcriptional regulator PadR
MPGEVQITTTVARVLRTFLEDVAQPRYGFELMRLTKLPSGTLYPILARLESAGWLASDLEEIDPATLGRPVRRMYRISPQSAQIARQELAAISEELRPPAAAPGRLFPRGGIA